MEKEIFKKENKPLKISLIIIKKLCLALLITLVASLVLGYKYLNVLTGSMEPTMPINTVVMIKKVPLKDVEVGDVVTFNNGTENVTHRVVEKEGLALRTKGDAAAGRDQYPVTDKNFVGVVIAYVPYLGYVLEMIKSNIIMITICVVLGLFIIIYS